MSAAQLDTEFMQYWSQLGLVEKESLLSVAKNYVHLKEEGNDEDLLRKKVIQREREAYLRGDGVSYSWQEVKDMVGKKRTFLNRH